PSYSVRQLPSFPTRRSSDLAVRVVVGDHDAVPPTESDRALEILARRHRRRRVVGIVQIDEPRPPDHLRRDLLELEQERGARRERDRKSTRLNSSHVSISYAV